MSAQQRRQIYEALTALNEQDRTMMARFIAGLSCAGGGCNGFAPVEVPYDLAYSVARFVGGPLQSTSATDSAILMGVMAVLGCFTFSNLEPDLWAAERHLARHLHHDIRAFLMQTATIIIDHNLFPPGLSLRFAKVMNFGDPLRPIVGRGKDPTPRYFAADVQEMLMRYINAVATPFLGGEDEGGAGWMGRLEAVLPTQIGYQPDLEEEIAAGQFANDPDTAPTRFMQAAMNAMCGRAFTSRSMRNPPQETGEQGGGSGPAAPPPAGGVETGGAAAAAGGAGGAPGGESSSDSSSSSSSEEPQRGRRRDRNRQRRSRSRSRSTRRRRVQPGMREVAVDGSRTVSILREPADEESYSMEYEATHANEAQRLTDAQAFNYPVAADDEKFHNPASMRRVMRLVREVVEAYPPTVPANQVRVHERASLLRRPEVRELVQRTCTEEYAAAHGIGIADVPQWADLPEYYTFPFLRTLAGIILTGVDDEAISDLVNAGSSFNYDSKFRSWKGVPQIGFTARVNKVMAVVLSLSSAKKDGIQQLLELLQIPGAGGVTPDAVLQDLNHIKGIASGISSWATTPTLKIWADANTANPDLTEIENKKTIWAMLLAAARAAASSPPERIDTMILSYSRTMMLCPPAKTGEAHGEKKKTLNKSKAKDPPAPAPTKGGKKGQGQKGKGGGGKSAAGKGAGDAPLPAHYCEVPHGRVKELLMAKCSVSSEAEYYEKMRPGACAYHVGQMAGLFDGRKRVFCPHGEVCKRPHNLEPTQSSLSNFNLLGAGAVNSTSTGSGE
eukprot:g3832.t1